MSARSRTFDEVFHEHSLYPEERAALVWHLAALRARKTVEALLPETKHDLDLENYGIRLTPSQRRKP